MENIFNVPSYFTTNAAAFSDALPASFSVLVIRMPGLLLGIILLCAVIYIMYMLRTKPFLE